MHCFNATIETLNCSKNSALHFPDLWQTIICQDALSPGINFESYFVTQLAGFPCESEKSCRLPCSGLPTYTCNRLATWLQYTLLSWSTRTRARQVMSLYQKPLLSFQTPKHSQTSEPVQERYLWQLGGRCRTNRRALRAELGWRPQKSSRQELTRKCYQVRVAHPHETYSML